MVNEMPLVLQGKVLLSSGALLAGNRILDWAFIELTSTATENFSVNKLPEISREKRPEMYGKSGFPQWLITRPIWRA
jgi:hypothetical protein